MMVADYALNGSWNGEAPLSLGQLNRCTDIWTKSYRIVGDTMGDIWNNGHNTDDAFLVWRLRALTQGGAILCDGELPRCGQKPKNIANIRLG